ncbi:MAG: tail fiber domain-containing protein [Flavobacteriales bacterium]|jgi:hypothetical protein|nr:tail fiber domain-containing protein [Flavobacteriales bacterium]MBK6891939.1 tail fiber domain-containing protein [Flavobacteriales bacterium]MBK7246076.1 tail fiber domain-containing protein [Flavobacteriales bacterium]MBK9598807.1 tail fiber domain-containing protein [Flavobacteriales bacterium]QQS71783.1 MAG: tail fiber domain-containing protein [Flavobacteriales bacterium]
MNTQRHHLTALLIALAFMGLRTSSVAQIAINAAGAAPDPSAMLDLSVATLPANGKQGFLCPRMTAVERIALPAPATGLLVYETTTNTFWYFNGSIWVALGGPNDGWRRVGNTGIIAGTHYLGTPDARPLEFRRSGVRSGYVSPNYANTSWGLLALAVNTGTDNTALGSRALAANTSGSRNTAVGAGALSSNLDGANSVAVGANALRVGTSVGAQTAVGSAAMENYTTGAGNTAVGAFALQEPTSNTCTAVGVGALGNSSGANNTACGYLSLASNTTGSGNTAFGSYTMSSITTGSSNTGFSSENHITTESNNTAFNGLLWNGGGSGNTTMGRAALPKNITGKFNTTIGELTHNENEDGDYSVALGSKALSNANGIPKFVNLCTAVGEQTNTGDVGDNMTAIGYDALALSANTIRIGNAANNTNLTGGFGAWQNLSDARFKRDIRENVPGLNFILRLRPVTYRFDVNAYDTFTGLADRMRDSARTEERSAYTEAVAAASSKRHTGFIAQEVDSLARVLSFEFSGVHRPIDEKDHYTIGYEQFVVPLVKAVQEQQEQLEALSQLRARINTRLVQLEAAEEGAKGE